MAGSTLSATSPGAQMDAVGVAACAYAAGFRGQSLVIITAISGAESGYNAGAVGYNNGTGPGGQSNDRGLFQINDYWHKEVSDACAFSPLCAARAAYKISVAGTQFSQWATFTNGLYKQELGRAQSAVVALKRAGGASRYIQAHNQQLNAVYGDASVAQKERAGITDVSNPLSGVTDQLPKIGDFLAALLDRATWIRVAEILGGILMIGAGLVFIAKSAGVGIPGR